MALHVLRRRNNLSVNQTCNLHVRYVQKSTKINFWKFPLLNFWKIHNPNCVHVLKPAMLCIGLCKGVQMIFMGKIACGWLGSRVVSVLDSGAEGPRFKSQSRCCRVTVLGKLLTPIVPLFTKQQNW